MLSAAIKCTFDIYYYFQWHYKLLYCIRCINKEKLSLWCVPIKWISADEVVRNTYPIIALYLKSLRVKFKQIDKQENKRKTLVFMVLYSSPMRKGLDGPLKDSLNKKLLVVLAKQMNKQTTNKPPRKKIKNTPWILEDLRENEDPNPFS